MRIPWLTSNFSERFSTSDDFWSIKQLKSVLRDSRTHAVHVKRPVKGLSVFTSSSSEQRPDTYNPLGPFFRDHILSSWSIGFSSSVNLAHKSHSHPSSFHCLPFFLRMPPSSYSQRVLWHVFSLVPLSICSNPSSLTVFHGFHPSSNSSLCTPHLTSIASF